MEPQKSSDPSKTVSKHIWQILKWCEEADQLISENDGEALIPAEMHHLRARILKSYKSILNDKEWNPGILDRIWKSCYHSVICRIRRAALSVEQKSWTEALITTFVKELCSLTTAHPQTRAVICIYVGDLRRYAWLISGVEKHRTLAMLCYQKSAKLYEENGTALNQQGLILQGFNRNRALLYFLLGNNASVPFRDAYSNILNLLDQKNGHKQEQQKEDEEITLAIVGHCFTCFSRLDFQELAVKWSERITLELENRHAVRVAVSMNIICLAAVALAGKGNEVEMRNLSGLLFGLIGTVIRILEEWSVAEVTIKRRRCASTSSSSSSSSSGDDVVSLDSDVEGGGGGGENEDDNDDEHHETKPTRPIKSANGTSERMKRNQETEHRIHTVLVALLHAATSVAPYLYSDRAPSAYYCQYEEYCQRLIQFLNLLELNLDGPDECLWQLGASTPWVLLPRFLRAFVQSPSTPVVFEDFFRFEPKNSTKENIMKSMAKLRLAHDAEEVQVRASLPVYVVPDENVLLERLNIIKTILKKTDLIVVVAEGTLRRLDHIKKEKPLARGALRWIHSHISGENGRFRIGQARQPMKCAEQLAARMPTACTVIATVLTMSDVVEEPTNKGMEKFKDSDER